MIRVLGSSLIINISGGVSVECLGFGFLLYFRFEWCQLVLSDLCLCSASFQVDYSFSSL